MKLTAAQVAAVAAGAGFTGAGLTKAVAVALAESGGDTGAVNVNTDARRSRDRGLWQINDYWHREVSDADAFNPVTAARHAHRISRGGQDWSQWSTWKNGAAAAQMGRAKLAAAQAARGPVTMPAGWRDDLGEFGLDLFDLVVPGDGVTEGLEAVKGVTDTVGAARQGLVLAVRAGAWLSDSHNWARVAMVTGGVVGIGMGLYLLGKSGAAGSTAATVARRTGGAAKAAATVAVTKGKVK